MLAELEFSDKEKVFVPASLLNQLRRELYEELSGKLQEKEEEKLAGIQIAAGFRVESKSSPVAAAQWLIKTDNPISLFGISKELAGRISEVIIEISENTNAGLLEEELEKIRGIFPQAALRLALPPICRNSRLSNISEIIKQMVAAGICRWQVSNLWGLQVMQEFSIDDISASAPLYTLNHASVKQQQKLGISWSTLGVEDEFENMSRLVALAGRGFV